jgi:hypothetical protein
MPTYDLWITQRCADDLGFAWPDSDGPAAVSDSVVQRFVHLRSEDPEPIADKISAVHGRTVYGLRVGDDRGITWFDYSSGCVFLLFVGNRASVYEETERRAASGELFPDEYDYEDLEFFRVGAWRRALRDVAGPELIADAIDDPEVGHVLETDRARITLMALPIDTGGHVLHMLIATPAGLAPIGHVAAQRIANTVVEHLGVEVIPITHFVGSPTAYDAFAFDAVIIA